MNIITKISFEGPLRETIFSPKGNEKEAITQFFSTSSERKYLLPYALEAVKDSGIETPLQHGEIISGYCRGKTDGLPLMVNLIILFEMIELWGC